MLTSRQCLQVPLVGAVAPNRPILWRASELARASRLRPEPPATRRFGRLKALSLSKGDSLPATSSGLVRHRPGDGGSLGEGGFTIVEVMMAAVILMVGFMGMISVMTVSSGMMDHARRQTLADQILTHEIEELRLATWTTINALPTASTNVTIDSQFTAAIAASGATYAVTRTVTSPNPYTNIREVNFTATWVVKTSRRDASNNPLSFTYQRTNTGWFGQYGLNLTYQRS